MYEERIKLEIARLTYVSRAILGIYILVYISYNNNELNCHEIVLAESCKRLKRKTEDIDKLNSIEEYLTIGRSIRLRALKIDSLCL